MAGERLAHNCYNKYIHLDNIGGKRKRSKHNSSTIRSQNHFSLSLLKSLFSCTTQWLHPYLNHQFRFHAPRRLMLSVAPAARDAVNLVEKHRRGGVVSCHFEQTPHQFLRLPSPFRAQRGGTHRKKSGLAFRGHGFGEQGFSRSRRPKHEHPFPRPPNPLEVLRHPQRQHHGFLELKVTNRGVRGGRIRVKKRKSGAFLSAVINASAIRLYRIR